MAIGARDPIDRALVQQYATTQTNKFDEVKISPDDMWKNINMMAMSCKVHSDLKKTMNIPKPRVALKGFWDK
ncbi:MAG: hypothetical protein A2039_04985 [Candidatus Melainabacteria bacterium GWA2_34_9]|nr:MAG: hypothetical protein A2039_04985 [Candidatus Melainabacteria bacterium GWA2_34_9]